MASVGNFNARYLEPVNGYIQIQKADYLLSFTTNGALTAINKTDICSVGRYTFEPAKATPDYVLVASRIVNSIKYYRVIKSADTASDHHPITCSLQISTYAFPSQARQPTTISWQKTSVEMLINYQLEHVNLLKPDMYSIVQIKPNLTWIYLTLK